MEFAGRRAHDPRGDASPRTASDGEPQRGPWRASTGSGDPYSQAATTLSHVDQVLQAGTDLAPPRDGGGGRCAASAFDVVLSVEAARLNVTGRNEGRAMKRTSALGSHWPAMLVGVLIVVLFVTALSVGSDGRFGKAVVFTAAAVPSVIALGQYLYMKVDRWRLFVNRIRLRLVNPETTINYSIDYTVESLIETHTKVTELLKRPDRLDTRQLSKAADGEVWLWRGVTVQLHYTQFSDPIEGSTSAIFRLRAPSLKASYRGIDKAIREDMGGLLAELEREVQASNRKYVVNLGFPDENPYFGLLVNRVNQDMVQRFDIDIFETSNSAEGHDRVRVHKDNLEVVATTAHDTQLLALRYLSCQPVPGGG